MGLTQINVERNLNEGSFKEEYGDAIVEVLNILDNMSKEDVQKIPKNFIKFLVDNASLEYKTTIQCPDLKCDNPELSLKVKELLNYIYTRWWSYKKIENLKLNQENNEILNREKINKTVKKEELIEYNQSGFKKIIKEILIFFKNLFGDDK